MLLAPILFCCPPPEKKDGGKGGPSKMRKRLNACGEGLQLLAATAQVCDLPRSPHHLPPSPALSDLRPPSLTCSRLLSPSSQIYARQATRAQLASTKDIMKLTYPPLFLIGQGPKVGEQYYLTPAQVRRHAADQTQN